MRKTDRVAYDDSRSIDRIFSEEDRWFVRTREGMRGPFGSRRAAEAEADLFVDTVKFLEQNHPSVPRDPDPDEISLIDIDKPWQ